MKTVIQSGTYVPGVCNINHMEIAKRRAVGYVGTAVFVVLLGILLIVRADWPWRLISFLPAYMAATGYLQAANRFCSGYGSRGKQNSTEGSLTAQEVTDVEAIRKDRQKSRQINIQSALIALVGVLIVLLLPTI